MGLYNLKIIYRTRSQLRVNDMFGGPWCQELEMLNGDSVSLGAITHPRQQLQLRNSWSLKGSDKVTGSRVRRLSRDAIVRASIPCRQNQQMLIQDTQLNLSLR